MRDRQRKRTGAAHRLKRVFCTASVVPCCVYDVRWGAASCRAGAPGLGASSRLLVAVAGLRRGPAPGERRAVLAHVQQAVSQVAHADSQDKRVAAQSCSGHLQQEVVLVGPLCKHT